MPVRIQLKYEAEKSPEMSEILQQACRQSGLPNSKAVLAKRSIDSRGKVPYFLFGIDVYAADETVNTFSGFKLQNVTNKPEVHIVGFGPAGIFAAMQLIENGYKPVIFERGKEVRLRRFDLADLVKNHEVNPDSNYCFGEGGAGTYSDGKLYTRSDKRGPVSKVLASLCEHGATEQILWDAHPHIGTNKLPAIIEKYRESILDCGGEIHFETRITDFVIQGNKIVSVKTAKNETISVSKLILATGHSARDIFQWFYANKIEIEAKPFAIGVRMEHSQSLIDSMQYHCKIKPEILPAASYSFVEQVHGKGVFSFCMCPGGIIAPAATSKGEVVVNGWSPSRRNGKFANSGFVVSVDEKDFKSFEKYGALSAMHYQQHYEQLAFATQGNLTAPAQRLEDFIQNKASSTLPECSYLPGIASRKLEEVLSDTVSKSIREALVALGKKYRAFRTNDAVLVGVESRTSSPVKIPRDKEKLNHVQLENLYPTGEGAGYAGGIMSAALDGMRVAQSILYSAKL
ncbi:MAG: FAD-dependent oxidoreductase [Bacteroidetes bacterium]|nr:FAD-dependent oxidoreductase [Bacteroidota bacterium]